MRLLIVDDDHTFRALLRATFESFDIEVDEAESAAAARTRIQQARPDVIVLDVRMPGESGLDLCRALKADPATSEIGIVLLTGSEHEGLEEDANALLTKPFRPLELLGAVERLAGGLSAVPFLAERPRDEEGQLMLYARDLRHLLELERRQRVLIEEAYHETVVALGVALESKDTGTRAHSQRVQRYARELASAIDPELAEDPGAEVGFLLHDIGKIGIPDRILLKPGPLTHAEREQMQTHTILGEQMLGGVAFLRGEPLRIVRSHHERWDGTGYPDRIGGEEIPLGARVFAVADAVDAITTDRPYRKAQSWEIARREVLAESGRQFDPTVVDAFLEREPYLRTGSSL